MVSAVKEPYQGWIDNANGPMGLSIANGKGILKISYINKEVCQDWIPVDVVVKSLLQVIWKRGATKYDNQFYIITTLNQRVRISFLCKAWKCKSHKKLRIFHLFWYLYFVFKQISLYPRFHYIIFNVYVTNIFSVSI